MANVNVTVRYFASARDRAGVAEEELELPAILDLGGLRAALSAAHPALAGVLSACRFAHNLNLRPGMLHLQSGDELVVMPPVSGG